MKLLILTAGSRGDVAPFIALAQGTRRAGHEVTLAAPADAEALVSERGIPYASLGIDYQALAGTQAGRGAVSGRPSAVLSALREVKEATRGMLAAAWEAAQGADALVYHPKSLAGVHVAEALRIPGFVALPLPLLVPTRAFPAPLGPLPNLGFLNRATYAAVRLSELPFRGIISRWRRERLGLPARSAFADPLTIKGQPIPVLYAFSRHLVPPPPDWPAHVRVTGYWFAEPQEGYTPPADLAQFLEAGAPPVYVGFGSMAGRDPEKTTRVVLDAVRRAGVRAILSAGWGGLSPSEVPQEVFVLHSAPHEWLFPRCAAVVHHGGAGTTHTGLRAGRPTVVCPFGVDQPFWGARVHALGAGPEPIPQKALAASGGADRLASAIREAVGDARIAERAAALAAAISEEHGVTGAVEAIESALAVSSGR